MKGLEENFKLAKKQDRKAQKELYEMFSAKMLLVANSYTNNIHDAEDILLNAFLKCFSKISECREWKSFPFWLRKIVVNDSITFVRKNKNVMYVDVEIADDFPEDEEENVSTEINIEEIFSHMPIGYRLIFNLYVFEDKKHQEIAEILNISEGTSKSQFSKAKKCISDYLKDTRNEKKYTDTIKI